MAKCEICEKTMQTGHRISINRSQVSRRANKTWKANVKKVKINDNGTIRSIYICTRCLRSGKVTRAIWLCYWLPFLTGVFYLLFYFFLTFLYNKHCSYSYKHCSRYKAPPRQKTDYQHSRSKRNKYYTQYFQLHIHSPRVIGIYYYILH